MAFAAAPVAVATSSSTSAKGVKRRNERNILTFYEKIAVIRYYEETNISRNSLAKMFHCCATQIRRILEKKHELLQQLATLSEADASLIIEEMTRKRRKFEMSAISFILHKWVERCRQLRLRKTITNQTLKETALKMAALLNLPAFRPSYRWLNRFRGKYRYNAEDLGAVAGEVAGGGDLSVEDIIIEYKDSLPSFMQKEIAAITSSAKVVAPEPTSSLTHSEDDNDEDDDDDDDVVEVLPSGRGGATWEADLENGHSLSPASSASSSDEATTTLGKAHPLAVATSTTLTLTPTPPPSSAGSSTALLTGIFPHLAVLHQFALLNADVKALELISQLGVHMQAQAESGSYKQLTLAQLALPGDDDAIYPDIDDIVLME